MVSPKLELPLKNPQNPGVPALLWQKAQKAEVMGSGKNKLLETEMSYNSNSDIINGRNI